MNCHVRRSPRTRTGFTLIELLVVIAIIAILAAILFPVFAKARAKARQITCISNQKQIGLAMMQYFQDYDECAPLVRIASPSGSLFNPGELTWKDIVSPYIKSGGRAYNSGQTYTQEGNGGVFQCPENTAAWSKSQAWGNGPSQPGDETTRFPRSYAVNDDAGVNELGANSHFWPVYYNPEATGAIAQLKTPAGTIMVGETRIVYPDIHSYYSGYECQQDGTPWGGVPYGCFQSHGGGFTNFIFFDGHAKSVRVLQAVQSDLWDCYAATGFGTTTQQNDINSVNGVKEWNPGF